jgi:hypothetical protein
MPLNRTIPAKKNIAILPERARVSETSALASSTVFDE